MEKQTTLHAYQLSNAISPPSCFFERRDVCYARHSLNARNVINWKCNLKKNIIKILKRKNKKGVIIRIEFFWVSLRYEMLGKLYILISETQKNKSILK